MNNLLHQTLKRHVVTEASAVAKKAEELKMSKYTHSDASYKFILVTTETNQCCFGPQIYALHERPWPLIAFGLPRIQTKFILVPCTEVVCGSAAQG